MGLSKRARNVASLTNQTTIYGIMGGLAPAPGSWRISRRSATKPGISRRFH